MKTMAKAVGEHDMTTLQDISVEGIAVNLKERLKAGIIYVSRLRLDCIIINLISTTNLPFNFCMILYVFLSKVANVSITSRGKYKKRTF